MNGSSSGVRERVAAAGDLEYRIAGRGGIVVVTLRPGEGLLAEPGGLLYRRGVVGWSLASTGRNVLGRILNRAMRRAAGASSLMHHYEGQGEFAQAAAPPCRLIATRLEPGDNLVVERRCLVAASPGVTVDVAFSRALRRRGEAGRVVLMRLTGTGVAFLQAAESSTEAGAIEAVSGGGGGESPGCCLVASLARPSPAPLCSSKPCSTRSTMNPFWRFWTNIMQRTATVQASASKMTCIQLGKRPWRSIADSVAHARSRPLVHARPKFSGPSFLCFFVVGPCTIADRIS